ncbi:MAG: hypothetical protein CO150_08040, partial [Nitrospirae bacterium CG_4_9_14_3_um_filter_53_35]
MSRSCQQSSLLEFYYNQERIKNHPQRQSIHLCMDRTIPLRHGHTGHDQNNLGKIFVLTDPAASRNPLRIGR